MNSPDLEVGGERVGSSLNMTANFFSYSHREVIYTTVFDRNLVNFFLYIYLKKRGGGRGQY